MRSKGADRSKGATRKSGAERSDYNLIAERIVDQVVEWVAERGGTEKRSGAKERSTAVNVVASNFWDVLCAIASVTCSAM